MTPEQHTPWTAADPATPPAVLAEIAAQRPDLRPAVAANPSAYPGLLQWLAGLGDPAVDAALRARSGQSRPLSVPSAPPAQAYGAPAAPYQTFGTPGYRYDHTAAAPRSSNKVLWIVLGGVVLLVVLGIAAVAFFVSAVREGYEEGVSGLPGAGQSEEELLEELYQACADGDDVACDDLYFEAPAGSDYQEFGDTCGGRAEAGSYCEGELVGGEGYGSNAELDALWDQCDGGDDVVCQRLYVESPYGSEYEYFGSTCGGREPDGTCR